MAEQVRFLATLGGANTSARPISIGADGDLKLVLEVPDSEAEAALQLRHLRGKLLNVTIEVAE